MNRVESSLLCCEGLCIKVTTSVGHLPPIFNFVGGVVTKLIDDVVPLLIETARRGCMQSGSRGVHNKVSLTAFWVRTQKKQTKSNQIKSNQIKSNQNQIKSNQTNK